VAQFGGGANRAVFVGAVIVEKASLRRNPPRWVIAHPYPALPTAPVTLVIRYLDPRIYLAFKRAFIEHPDLLKSLLNALLPLPDDGLIDRLEYLTPS
jgi:hypothetical protein